MPLSPDAEKAALQDLVQSHGWAVLKGLVDDAFGPAAVLRKMDEAMKELQPGDTLAQVDTYGQIRAASKAAHLVLTMAEERLKQLEKATAPAKPGLYESFRRAPR